MVLVEKLENMSNETTKTTTTSGIGFAGLLTIAFIVLRLCGVISWKWIWVLSPIWISISICILIWAVAMLIMWLAMK